MNEDIVWTVTNFATLPGKDSLIGRIELKLDKANILAKISIIASDYRDETYHKIRAEIYVVNRNWNDKVHRIFGGDKRCYNTFEEMAPILKKYDAKIRSYIHEEEEE